MTKLDVVFKWMVRAKSNLAMSKNRTYDPDILFEDYCFNAQQCVEKSLKALCLNFDIFPPKTHNIKTLVGLIEENKIQVPSEVKKATKLNNYSVKTRYPGDYPEVDEKEYQRVIKIAEDVFKWVCKKLDYPR